MSTTSLNTVQYIFLNIMLEGQTLKKSRINGGPFSVDVRKYVGRAT